MGTKLINGVIFFPLPPISTTGGSVMHAIKGLDDNLTVFGECYFSTARKHDPKAWKKHAAMTCNLFVPKGRVRFVFYDDRADSCDSQKTVEWIMSAENYGRLVIKPGIWFGFAGLDDQDSIIFNVADIPHDPAESTRLEPESGQVPYTWNF